MGVMSEIDQRLNAHNEALRADIERKCEEMAQTMAWSYVRRFCTEKPLTSSEFQSGNPNLLSRRNFDYTLPGEQIPHFLRQDLGVDAQGTRRQKLIFAAEWQLPHYSKDNVEPVLGHAEVTITNPVNYVKLQIRGLLVPDYLVPQGFNPISVMITQFNLQKGTLAVLPGRSSSFSGSPRILFCDTALFLLKCFEGQPKEWRSLTRFFS